MTSALQLPTTPPLSGAAEVADINVAMAALAGSPKAVLASAATVDLGSVATLNIEVSGNVNISSFGTNANLLTGQYKFVRFTGNLTITRAAGVIDTQNNQNISVRPGDLLELSYTGTGWQVLSFTPAGARIFLLAARTHFVRTAPATVTVSIASPGVVTWTAHGLQANDPVVFTTSTLQKDSLGLSGLPAPLVPGVVYYVVGASITTNTFQVSAAPSGAAINTTGTTVTITIASPGVITWGTPQTVTISIASPAVVSWTNHGLVPGQAFVFGTTGALPTGITAGTTYYVLAAAFSANSFWFGLQPNATWINATGTQSGVQSITVGHNFAADTPVIFATTGALPTGIVAGTTYFALGASMGTTTFRIGATAGGAAINTTGSQSGTQSAQSGVLTATTGNDSNDGLTQTRAGALLNMQKAYDNFAGMIDMGGQTGTIQLADSCYTAGINVGQPWTGGGQIILQGNAATPYKVFVNTSGSCAIGAAPLPGALTIKDMMLQSYTGTLVGLNAPGTLNYQNIIQLFCSTGIAAQGAGATVVALGNVTVAGSGISHNYAQSGGVVFERGVTVNVKYMPSFPGGWVGGSSLGLVAVPANTYVDHNGLARQTTTGNTHTNDTLDTLAINTSLVSVGMQIVGSGIPTDTVVKAILSSSSVQMSAPAGSSLTTTSIKFELSRGPKYTIDLLTGVNAGGGADYLPGTVAGSAATGAQYQ